MDYYRVLEASAISKKPKNVNETLVKINRVKDTDKYFYVQLIFFILYHLFISICRQSMT